MGSCTWVYGNFWPSTLHTGLLQDKFLTLCEPTVVCPGASRNVSDERADGKNATYCEWD